jgi:hypothetical protein
MLYFDWASKHRIFLILISVCVFLVCITKYSARHSQQYKGQMWKLKITLQTPSLHNSFLDILVFWADQKLGV